MAETAGSYDQLSDSERLDAFYADLLIGGASRFTPRPLTEKQRETMHAEAAADDMATDPSDTYGKALEAQAASFRTQFSHLTPALGDQALYGM